MLLWKGYSQQREDGNSIKWNIGIENTALKCVPLGKAGSAAPCRLLKGGRWKKEGRNRNSLSGKGQHLGLAALRGEKTTICITLQVQRTVGTGKRCSANLSVAGNDCFGMGYLASLFAQPVATRWPSRCCVFLAVFSPVVVPGMLWLTASSCWALIYPLWDLVKESSPTSSEPATLLVTLPWYAGSSHRHTAAALVLCHNTERPLKTVGCFGRKMSAKRWNDVNLSNEFRNDGDTI